MDALVFLQLGAPWAPAQAFLQRSITELREADPNRVRQRSIFYVKPFEGQSSDAFLGVPDRYPVPAMRHFGTAHLIYGPLVRAGYKAEQPLPQREIGLDAQK